MPKEISFFLGYIFSVVIGYWFTREYNRKVWEFLSLLELEKSKKKDDRPQLWAAQQVGIIERFLYTSSILFAGSELIAVWVGIKALSQWKRWDGETHAGRANFNLYLVGSGLSLLYGILGAQIAIWLNDSEYLLAFLSVVGLVVLNVTFIAWIDKEIKQKKADRSLVA
jgi:hypothetical protein